MRAMSKCLRSKIRLSFKTTALYFDKIKMQHILTIMLVTGPNFEVLVIGRVEDDLGASATVNRQEIFRGDGKETDGNNQYDSLHRKNLTFQESKALIVHTLPNYAYVGMHYSK